jgi:hypothetical protein
MTLTHNESVILFGLIWGCAMTVYLLVKRFVGKGKEVATLLPTKEPKSHNPICPFDLQECDIHQELTLSGCHNCHSCDRGNNGVRATGGMPNLEAAVKTTKKVVIAVTGRKGCL